MVVKNDKKKTPTTTAGQFCENHSVPIGPVFCDNLNQSIATSSPMQHTAPHQLYSTLFSSHLILNFFTNYYTYRTPIIFIFDAHNYIYNPFTNSVNHLQHSNLCVISVKTATTTRKITNVSVLFFFLLSARDNFSLCDHELPATLCI